MKKFIFIVLAFLFIQNSFAQDKPPVALNDTLYTSAGVPVSKNILLNDYTHSGNHISGFYINTNTSSGELEYMDSVLTYTPYYYYVGKDSMLYQVQDVETGLLSEFATIFFNVKNTCYAQLDINNFSARINCWGNHFSNMSNDVSEVPVNSGINPFLCNSLWIGGNDPAGNLHFAGEIK